MICIADGVTALRYPETLTNLFPIDYNISIHFTAVQDPFKFGYACFFRSTAV